MQAFSNTCSDFDMENSLYSMFDKVDGFIGDYDGTKYLVLLHLEKYNPILDRIRYVIWLKSGTTCLFSQLCKNRNWFRW